MFHFPDAPPSSRSATWPRLLDASPPEGGPRPLNERDEVELVVEQDRRGLRATDLAATAAAARPR